MVGRLLGKWLVVGESVVGGFNKTRLHRSLMSACVQNHTKLAVTIIK